jgi:endogenous inhibitor of DNA gyrase (YacG/DUF329 family)
MKYCPNCEKPMPHRNRGIVYALFWPWTMLFMKKKCSKCGTQLS